MSRLPVVLIHGVAVRDQSIDHSRLWGRIPDRLTDEGFLVRFGNQNAWSGVSDNAAFIVKTINQVLEESGAAAVHLVAHSKGGLDARKAIHDPAMAGRIASLTTLATPHNGLKFCDELAKSHIFVPYVVGPVIDLEARLQGDIHPKSLDALLSLTTAGADEILEENPDLPAVHYRSFAFVPEDKRLAQRNLGGKIISLFDGENDGIVPLASAQNEYLIIAVIGGDRGYGHDDCIDKRERTYTVTLPGGLFYPSIPDFVVDLMVSMDDEVARESSVGAA